MSSSGKANEPNKDEEHPDRNVKGKEKMLEEEAGRGKRKRDEYKERACYKCRQPGHIVKFCWAKNFSQKMRMGNYVRPLLTPEAISEIQNEVDGCKLEIRGNDVIVSGQRITIVREGQDAVYKFFKKASAER